MPPLPSRLLFAAALATLSACGARTLLDVPPDGAPAPDRLVPRDVPPPDDRPPPLCTGTLTACNGVCVDLQRDRANCGACGSSCGPTGTCSGGTCVGKVCPSPLTACGGACVDTRSDLRHCGSCNNACPDSATCNNGVCERGPRCPMDQLRCGLACIDPRTDPSHCGACNSPCPAGQGCVEGRCEPSRQCPPGLTLCGPGRCVDLQRDPSNCGGCGAACRAINGFTQCVVGMCSIVCRPGFGNCDGDASNGCETSLGDNPRHCGFCGMRCNDGAPCEGGMCLPPPPCPAGTRSCGGRCVSVDNDPANCGVCGNVCPPGNTCAAGECRPMTMPTRGLRIDALLTTGCRTAPHAEVTGDDRGGIALAGDRVFYTGDEQTAGFDAQTLAPVARAGRRLDGIFGELSLGLPFTLASNRTPFDEATSIVDAVLQVSASGAVGMTAIPLSQTMFLDRSRNDVGVFAGPLRVLVTQGARAWLVDGTSGLAAPRVSAMMITPIGTHMACESWAYWGVLEVVEGQLWATYVRDPNNVVRQNVVTGVTRIVATFPGVGLADMCSFTVSPSRGRWYFHHEGASMFATGDETIGYCDARLTTM